jgi:hypothetical protein
MCAAEEKPDPERADCVVIGMSVRVRDPEALRAYARSRYAACWFDGEWEPADLAEAVLEALVISNENPSPDDYGIEILDAETSELTMARGAAEHSVVGGLLVDRG